MKIPCVQRIDWVVAGLSFLQPAMSSIQFYNLTLVVTALLMGSRFKLSEICQMWLYKKSISTMSYFFSDAKFTIADMQKLYIVRVLSLYNISSGGYLIVDDTMDHHTAFCKWIFGAYRLFDHTYNTNVTAKCIVFLYYSDGCLIKFPIDFRLFCKEDQNKIPWQIRDDRPHQTKNELALEMIREALDSGFPKTATVLADSWFCVEVFIRGLQELELPFVLEMKNNNKIRIPYKQIMRKSNGKPKKKQHHLIGLPEYFSQIVEKTYCGFGLDSEAEKPARVLYQVKVANVRFNAFPGKHRVVRSLDPAKGTIKYLLTNQLHWDATKILSEYSCRWVIEEFFRNAKQLSNLEGACLRSKQGVTLSLYLIAWIDFLLHYRNYQGVTEKSQKESLSISSIIRQVQFENMQFFIKGIQEDEALVKKWIDSTQKNISHSRKKRTPLEELKPKELETPPHQEESVQIETTAEEKLRPVTA